MHSRTQTDPAVIARLPLGKADPTLCQHALALAGGFAFALDADGTLAFADTAALERRLFLRPGTLVTTREAWQARLSPADLRLRRRAVSSLTWSGARASVDYDLRDGRGETLAVREVLECGDDGQLRGVLIDRTDDVQAAQRQVWSARHDGVTGLENRAVMIERGQMLAALSTRAQLPAHLLRLRITNQAELESVYGAEAGDRLVQQFARRLEDMVRLPDIVARLDETDFGICLLGTDVDALSARLQRDASDTPYNTPFGPLYLDLASHALRLSALPGSVEVALAKTRDFMDGVAAPHATPTQATDVIAALDEDRISVAFQPIVHAESGAVHHHECLLRLCGEDGRIVSAGQVVQDAERLGLVDRLDERALALATPHLLRHAELHLALNVSAGTLGNDASAERYLDGLRQLGEAAARVTIEMTETLAVDDPAKAARFSAAVRDLGCRFSIDDFGSGYTTFRNLMAVEADSIKIDGTLVRGIATDENKQTFMRMMVDLAQTFNVATVAEMVETDADAAVLRRMGVDYLQGYHFGHPAPSPVWSRLGA